MYLIQLNSDTFLEMKVMKEHPTWIIYCYFSAIKHKRSINAYYRQLMNDQGKKSGKYEKVEVC